MARSTRTTIETGIYEDTAGFEVVARVGRLRQSKRFESDATLKMLRDWRDGKREELRTEPQPTKDTRLLSGAVAAYIEKTKLPKAHAYRPGLNAWVTIYGDLERRKLTPALVSQALDRWKHDGYSQQSLYYRRLVLEKLWKALDGPKAKTPVDDLKVSRPKGRRPVWVPDDIIYAVALELLKREATGATRSPKTRARYLVLATTGQRPAQLKRTQPEDVDLQRGVWWVRAAKGGEPTPVFLNAEMLAAWTLFARVGAWGTYDKRNFVRTIRRAGWPKGVRPYNLRHAVALTLRNQGADLGDIQDHLGHTSMATTRVYATAIEPRMRDVSATLEGRFFDGQRGTVRGTERK